MKFLEFLRKQTERELEILKFLGARRFGLQAASERESEILKFNAAEHLKSRAAPQKQAAGLLKLASEPPHNRSKILNFMPKPRDRFRILQPTYALVCLAGAVRNFISQHRFRILKFVPGCVHYTYIAQNFASQCEFKILKFIHELPHALRNALTRALLRCTSLRADKAEAERAVRLTSQHTHDATEKRSAVKFNHAGGYSNFVRRRIVRLRSTAARRNYEAWRSEIYAVCLHKYSALIRAASGKISRYEVWQATNASLSRGVQRMKFYALNRHAMKFLKFLGARRFGLQAVVGRGFEILKFSAAERLKRRFEPQKQAAELLNSSSLLPCRFKLALLKFAREVPRNRSEILNFMFASYKLKLALRKFTLAPRKIKSASALRLNFDLNSVSQARAAKFENGVKFKGAAKFERSAR